MIKRILPEIPDKRKCAAGTFFLAGGFILMCMSRISRTFAQWYSTHIYPVWVNVTGRIMGIFAFSVSEVLLYAALLAVAVSLIRLLVKAAGKCAAKRDFLAWGCTLYVFAGALFFLYALNCGVNYHRESFSESSRIEMESYTAEELKEVCLWLTKEVNGLSGSVGRDADGVMRLGAEKVSRIGEDKETKDDLGATASDSWGEAGGTEKEKQTKVGLGNTASDSRGEAGGTEKEKQTKVGLGATASEARGEAGGTEKEKQTKVGLGDTVSDIRGEGGQETARIGQISDKTVNQEAVRAMECLGRIYPELSGFYPNPKGLLCPWILSVQQLTGVYSPFTVEANYNSGVVDYNIPFTMCHELSHLRGFMQEEEANFIAFLASTGSKNVHFQYSGYLMGWTYCMNVLYKADYDAWEEVRGQLSKEAEPDLAANREFWDRYDGRIAEVSSRVNDTYLKANNQSEGVESYDKMVDLIVAYRKNMLP